MATGWSNVKEVVANTGSGNKFLVIEVGKKTRIHLLGEPFGMVEHIISEKNVNGEDVFLSFRCSEDDTCFVCNNNNRYRKSSRVAFNVYDYESSEVKIFTMGKTIWDAIVDIYDNPQTYGPIDQLDFIISKTGTGKATRYSTQQVAMAGGVGFAALELYNLEGEFPIPTAEEIERSILDSGIDPYTDPVDNILRTMSLEDAYAVKLQNGKHKGKTMREIYTADTGYITWLAKPSTTFSDVEVSAAARIITNALMAQPGGRRVAPPVAPPTAPPAAPVAPPAAPVAPPAAPVAPPWVAPPAAPVAPPAAPVAPVAPPAAPVAPPAAPAAPVAPPVEAGPSDSLTRQQRITVVNSIFESDPRYQSDFLAIAQVLQKAGSGKTRLKDFTDTELDVLLRELTIA